MRLRLRIVLALLAVCQAGAVYGLASDHNQPIEIQADRVTLDEKKKISVYEGKVELVQGTLRVTADRIEIRRGAELERVIATGNVTFRQQPDGEGKEIRGEAQRVDYQALKPSLELSGGARLWQGEDEFRGSPIIYEADRNVVRAGAQGEAGSDGRVHATIHPRKSQSTEEKK